VVQRSNLSQIFVSIFSLAIDKSKESVLFHDHWVFIGLLLSVSELGVLEVSLEHLQSGLILHILELMINFILDPIEHKVIILVEHEFTLVFIGDCVLHSLVQLMELEQCS